MVCGQGLQTHPQHRVCWRPLSIMQATPRLTPGFRVLKCEGGAHLRECLARMLAEPARHI